MPSVANANGTPALASAAAVASCSFHSALRWASTRSGSSRSAGGRLAVLLLGGDPGLLGEVQPQHDRDLGRLEPVGDLGGLAPPTITAVVPNSSARSSARWISSRVFASHQTASFLARAAWSALKAGSNGGCGAAVCLVEGSSFRRWSASSMAWRKWAIEPIRTRG